MGGEGGGTNPEQLFAVGYAACFVSPPSKTAGCSVEMCESSSACAGDPRLCQDQHCKSRMAGFKSPTSVDFVDVIPRTATGKVQKFKLRDEFWIGRDRQVN